MELSLKPALDFAVNAAWDAGRVTLRYFQTGVAVERKADASPVTIADRESERLLRDAIQRYYPDHGIIGEEYGTADGSQRYTWIIDPIDGTKSFIHGVPIYGVLVALTEGERGQEHTLVGVAHFPALNETIYAARGDGCYWNGRRAHVSTVSDLKDALLLSSEIAMPDEPTTAVFNKLIQSTWIQRTWADSYGYALVATSRAEIMLDPKMHIWDNAPFPVIMEEAGGTFSDWQGNPSINAMQTLATNGALLQPTLALLNGG